MKLVGKRGPDAFAVDARATLHVETVVAQPARRDQLAHLRIARMEPVPGPVEGEAVDQVGAAEAPQPVLGFEQRAARADLARAGHAGQPAAHHDGSPTRAHTLPRLITIFRGHSLALPGTRC